MNTSKGKDKLQEQLDKKGVKRMEQMVFQTAEGNTHHAIDIGLGDIRIRTTRATDSKVFFMEIKGNMTEFKEYLIRVEKAKIIDHEIITKPLKVGVWIGGERVK